MRNVFQAPGTSRRWLLAVACAALLPVAALAQNFPSKPVHLVVTYPAGGSSDQTGDRAEQDARQQGANGVSVSSGRPDDQHGQDDFAEHRSPEKA